MHLPADLFNVFLAQDTSHMGEVYVHFFGGEPLIQAKTVDHLASQLLSWSHESGIKLKLGITTNGGIGINGSQEFQV
jgi:sulfatase maturation enzyme AslB (radical SAM superfamily)